VPSQFRTLAFAFVFLAVGLLFPFTTVFAAPLNVGPAPRAANITVTPPPATPASNTSRVYVQPRYKIASQTRAQSLYIRVVDAEGNGVSQATVKITVRNTSTSETQVVNATDSSGYTSYALSSIASSSGAKVLVKVEARWDTANGEAETASAGTSYVVWP